VVSIDFSISFKRLQFPDKVSFALTINKSQCQTFSLEDMNLRKEYFSLGQLYVSLSQVGIRGNQYILLSDNGTASNIIHREVLNN
jgi:ATP-dependent DNA helicase PIF1